MCMSTANYDPERMQPMLLDTVHTCALILQIFNTQRMLPGGVGVHMCLAFRNIYLRKTTLWMHSSSYQSRPPGSAVVYFFPACAPSSIKNAKFCPVFGHFWLFCHEITHFLVPLLQA